MDQFEAFLRLIDLSISRAMYAYRAVSRTRPMINESLLVLLPCEIRAETTIPGKRKMIANLLEKPRRA